MLNLISICFRWVGNLNSPLHNASSRGHDKVVKLLLEVLASCMLHIDDKERNSTQFLFLPPLFLIFQPPIDFIFL